LSSWTAAWASQIGITTAFVILWLTFIVLAPGTFLSENIYLSFAQTTPFFALVAMPLTMVIIAGDIDLSFPSVMALGMVGFVFVWQATAALPSARPPRSASGAAAGLFNGLIITFVGIPRSS
jgi:simple sugar transport system permease protein